MRVATLLLWVAGLAACTDGSDDSDQNPEYGERSQDWDGDGSPRPEDCNDADALAFPGADERCNGADDDCDAEIDEETTTTYFRDRDADGFGADSESFDICYAPQGYVAVGGDCDDADPSIRPGADERCDIDGADEDCDGLVNEADPGVVDAWPAWTDGDHDGFGTGASASVACFVRPGLAAVGGDCDDGSALRNPAGIEICDGADTDEDCDGLADDADPEGPDGAIGWYRDADADGYGDALSGPKWFCEGPPSGYVADTFDCDDTVNVSNPGHYEVCDDALDNDCDGAPDDCGPLPAIDLGTADLIIQATAGSSELGTGVSAADLDGDGVVDLVLGAPRETFVLGGEGAVHVVPGSLRGTYDVDDVETVLFEGAGINEAFGARVTGLPDIDGDGYGEIVVSSTGAGGSADTGIRIFDGPYGSSATGETSAMASVLAFSQSRCGLGYGYGDVDGDGDVDHVVGCPGASSVPGSVFVILGPLSGIYDEVDDGRIEGTNIDDAFGTSIAILDVDADGIDDVATSAIDFDGAGTRMGGVFVVLGPDFVGADTDAEAAAVSTFTGVVTGEAVGASLSGGDVDGDGYVDLFVGAPDSTVGTASNAGRVYGLLGPFDDATMAADIVITGEDANDSFGQSVDVHGDVNGDRVDDLLVGAPADGGFGGAQPGGAYLFEGRLEAGTFGAPVARARMDGQIGGERAGFSVALVPDLSGDGRADLLIGAADYKPAGGVGGSTYGGAYLVTSDRL